MSQPAFDPTMFGGQPSTPPIPIVVCWDDLDPINYVNELSELGDWIAWFRATYRIPATVLPPCWFTHPGLREDIGHLWTGWLLTRHPDAGVGMIGLDWDQRRGSAIGRPREATAITGCTASRHQPEPSTTVSNAVEQLWQDHLDSQSQQRALAAAHQAVTDVVVEILQAAELRHELAPTILADLADDSANRGDDLIKVVAERLGQIASEALERAAGSAQAATTTVGDAQQHLRREAALADARDCMARSLAASALHRDGTAADLDENLARNWLNALEQILPAAVAADRAVAAAAARTAAVDYRAAARRHHPHIEDLLQ